MGYREGWRDYKLGKICTKIGSGATPKGGKEAYLEKGEFSLIRSQNVLDFSFSYNGLAFIDQRQAKRLDNVAIEADDVLINITGDSVARVCQAPSRVLPARVNQHVAILRSRPDILNSRFLKYYLLSPIVKNNLLSIAGIGATRNALTKGILEEYTVKIPPLPTQKKIAVILSSLDDKIELNRQMNQTLEEMAQTLFRELCTLPEGTDLPEGWAWKKVGDLYKTTSGGTPSRVKTEFYEHGEYLWVKSKELYEIFVFETEEKITKDAIQSSSAKLLPPYSLLVAMYGATVGQLSILGEPATCNQAICAILPNKEYTFSFIYSYLKENRLELMSRAVGSAQQNISQLLIKDFDILVPPLRAVSEFQSRVNVLYEKILENMKEIKALSLVRDSLLPKLMSGDLEVQYHD